MIRPDENIEDWFRQNADKLEVTPEDEVWDRLNDSLDMDEVWGKLDTSLERDKVRAFWFKRSAVAAAILALFALTLWGIAGQGSADEGNAGNGIAGSEIVNPPIVNEHKDEVPFDYNKEKPLLADNEAASTPDGVEVEADKAPANPEVLDAGTPVAVVEAPNTPVVLPNTPNNPVAPVAVVNQLPKKSTPLEETADAVIAKNETPTDLEKESNDLPVLKSLQVTGLDSRTVELWSAAEPTSDQLVPEEDVQNVLAIVPEFVPYEDKGAGTSRFYVGAAVGVKNQWLMNHETYETFRSEGLDHAVADFSSAQNVNFGMRIADRFGVQADYSFLAGAGQKYQEYSSTGRFVNKELDFQYQKMLVAFRYNRKSKKFLGREISDHMALGMYGGYLTEAQRIGGIEGSAKFLPNYRNVDFGFTGAYEVNYALIPRLKLSTGLRLQQGLVNIYRGTSTVPADFDRTFNASVDLLFGLKYELQKIR